MGLTAVEITTLLQQARAGDRGAESQLIRSVYPELRKLARRYMAGERCQHTLQPTALVNEAYIRIFGGAAVDWHDRAHFLAVASRQMRRVLADHGREFRAEKRANGMKVALGDHNDVAVSRPEEIEVTEELIQRLEVTDPCAAQVTVLKFFGGMTDQEVADALGTSHSQVRRHWSFARAWLRQRLAGNQFRARPEVKPG